MYLDWEAKVEQNFKVNNVEDQRQVDLVVVEFKNYVMTWWHKVCKDNFQGPSAASWMDIKVLTHAGFFPLYYRRGLLLKLQRLQQRHICVNEYFKELESLILRVGLEESNEEKITRFISV